MMTLWQYLCSGCFLTFWIQATVGLDRDDVICPRCAKPRNVIFQKNVEMNDGELNE